MFEDVGDRVVVVTGGARGLGYSIASAFAKAGAAVGLIDLLPAVKESAARLASEYGVRTAAVTADVTDSESVSSAFAGMRESLGTPDVLVTAAGITHWKDSADVTADEWQKMFSVNLNGSFFACQEFAKPLLASGQKGSVILISSMSGFIVNRPQNQTSYNASKAAVSQMGASLAVEWASRGIRVNAIAPGYFLSDMTRQFTEENPELKRQWVDGIPAGRMGEPEDLHGLSIYLASESASYLTGQTIIIDGGYTLI